jgi:hypothetical protein
MSEKGIGYILNDYIEKHSLEILKDIESCLDVDDAEIHWLDLPTQFIDAMNDMIFLKAYRNLLRYHHYSREIEIRDIENLIDSKRWEEVKTDLILFKYTITIPKGHKRLSVFEKDPHLSIKITDKNGNNKKDNSIENYKNGILTKKDIDFIKKEGLSPLEISSYHDGWYSSFSDIEIYSIYEDLEIKKYFNQIIYNALISKVQRINMFCSLYYFLGNIPQFIYKYDIDVDMKKIFNCFLVFLEISFLTNWDIKKQ